MGAVMVTVRIARRIMVTVMVDGITDMVITTDVCSVEIKAAVGQTNIC